MFDADTYFENIRSKNKKTCPPAAQANRIEYQKCTITGIESMEDVLSKFATAKAYFGIDDTNDGQTIQGESGGYVERRIYVIYLLKKFDTRQSDKMVARKAIVDECRAIYRDICSKLIKDRRALANDMVYLKTDRIPYFELPGYMLSGVAGLYFMVTIDQPTDLQYNETNWNE